MRALAAACACLALSGCLVSALQPLPAAPELSPSTPIPPAEAPLAIAVRRPQWGDWIPDEEILRGLTLAARKRQGENLIAVLRRSGLYSEVGWADEMRGPATALVRAVEGPLPEVDPEDPREEPYTTILFGLTLGLIPATAIQHHGIYFQRADVVAPSIRCDWRMRAVIGWPALFLAVLPSWQLSPASEAYDAEMRRCLARHDEVLRGAPP